MSNYQDIEWTIYILSNSYIPNIYNIGTTTTTKDVQRIAEEISSNKDFPGEWDIVNTWTIYGKPHKLTPIFQEFKDRKLNRANLYNFEDMKEAEVIIFIDKIISKVESKFNTESTNETVSEKTNKSAPKVHNEIGSKSEEPLLSLSHCNEEQIQEAVREALNNELKDPKRKVELKSKIVKVCDDNISGLDWRINSLKEEIDGAKIGYLIIFICAAMLMKGFIDAHNAHIGLMVILPTIIFLIITIEDGKNKKKKLLDDYLEQAQKYHDLKDQLKDSNIFHCVGQLGLERSLTICGQHIYVGVDNKTSQMDYFNYNLRKISAYNRNFSFKKTYSLMNSEESSITDFLLEFKEREYQFKRNEALSKLYKDGVYIG